MVQLGAGTAGPVGKPARVLIVHDDIGAWYCENGLNWSWSRGDLHADGTGPAAGMNAAPPVISASLSSSARRQCATRCLTALMTI